MRNKVRQILKRLVFRIAKPISGWYFGKPRWYKYNGLRVIVNPNVFFPHATISTKVFLNYLSNINLQGQSVLELGAGCGILSFYCAKKKDAKVTASDISKAAIENLKENEALLGYGVKVIHSDLFDDVTDQFDLILINPPYYPKNPISEKEKAWYCGEDFEYFKKLAGQLLSHLTKDGFALMILSEDCEIGSINSILTASGISMKEVWSTVKFGEQNYIFELR